MAIKMIRMPVLGWVMVQAANMFIKKMLPDMILRKLTKEEMDYYAAPYQTMKSRKPLLAWPKAVPFGGGKPKAVAEAVSSWKKWLTVTDIPKLCFYVTPGVAIKEKDVKIIMESMKNLIMIHLGEGLHFIQEDYPHEIGSGIAEWYNGIK